MLLSFLWTIQRRASFQPPYHADRAVLAVLEVRVVQRRRAHWYL